MSKEEIDPFLSLFFTKLINSKGDSFLQYLTETDKITFGLHTARSNEQQGNPPAPSNSYPPQHEPLILSAPTIRSNSSPAISSVPSTNVSNTNNLLDSWGNDTIASDSFNPRATQNPSHFPDPVIQSPQNLFPDDHWDQPHPQPLITDTSVQASYDNPFSPDVSKTRKKVPVDDEDRDLCKVCFDNPIDTVVIPCGHSALCNTCVTNHTFDTCPICRTPATRIIKIYKA